MIADQVLRLRALVLALGESSPQKWWRTEFMSETGLRFLERIYPRTFFQAAIHAAGRAACETHDQAIGRRGVYHLFRLPEPLEAGVRSIAPTVYAALLDDLRPRLGDWRQLGTQLHSISDGSASKASGPQRIGAAAELARQEPLKRIAAVYHAAFMQGRQAYPYFEAPAGGEG